MPLHRRFAIVTLAEGGLGRSHTLLLAPQASRVVVNDNAQGAADRVAAKIVVAGREAVASAGLIAKTATEYA